MIPKIFIATIFISFFTSCKFEEVTVSKVENFNIISLGVEGIEAEISLRIKNPNNYGFTLYNSDLNVKLNGTDIGKAVIINKVKIKKHSEDVHKVIVKSTFSQHPSSGFILLASTLGRKSATVAVNGQIKAGNIFYKKTFPVDVKEKVQLTK